MRRWLTLLFCVLSITKAFAETAAKEPCLILLTNTDFEANDQVDARSEFARLRTFFEQNIVGQKHLINSMLETLLADGHILLEGAAGLTKTRMARTFALGIGGDFSRIQMTSDLMPSDVIGFQFFDQSTGHLRVVKGPIFGNIVLIDEINRAPSKTQSATLQPMEERKVTIGGETLKLPKLFVVVATQNPMEHAGTNPLPEAQMDRFLMKLNLDYPSLEEEGQILDLVRDERLGVGTDNDQFQPVSESTIFHARNEVLRIRMGDSAKNYLLKIVQATRKPAQFAPGAKVEKFIAMGAGPRGSIALDLVSKAHAWLRGETEATREDIIAVAKDVLRHRIKLTPSALHDGLTPDIVLDRILQNVTP